MNTNDLDKNLRIKIIAIKQAVKLLKGKPNAHGELIKCAEIIEQYLKS